MFKRLLTFALAGILVLETPATAFAAGQSMNPTGGTAVQSEMNELHESGDTLVNENDAENQSGGGGGVLLNS